MNKFEKAKCQRYGKSKPQYLVKYSDNYVKCCCKENCEDEYKECKEECKEEEDKKEK